MAGLYLHIPFCKQACSYCDFYFVTRMQHKAGFVRALIREITSKKDTLYTAEPVETIYFGGGTPSLLTKTELADILDAVYSTFEVRSAETTVEMNPDDVTAEYLADLKSLGVNRVSMGVQSFDKNLLTFMHRAHTSEESLTCLQLLKESGIETYNADLIYGNPGETLEILEKDLETLLSFSPPHVSAYSLTIEPRTRIGVQVELGRLIPADDDEVAVQFDLVEKRLAEHGVERYEVSNFARPGKEALHNSHYWTHVNYLGLGPAAHSFWWDEDKKGARRFSNKRDVLEYNERDFMLDGPERSEHLGLGDLAEERLMLALRTAAGIDPGELSNRYNYRFSGRQNDYIAQKRREGKINPGPGLSLSSEGLRIADAIVLDIITLH